MMTLGAWMLSLLVCFHAGKGGAEATDLCAYSCNSGGGCAVLYKGPPRSGPTSGSCFSASFGGSCSGTPPECDDCNKAVTCNEGSSGEGFVELIDSGSEKKNPTGATSDSCLYKCNDKGGCTVHYTGPPRGGATSGSCFPASFGGSCSGTPPECQNCNKAVDCQEETDGDENIIGTLGGSGDIGGGTIGTLGGIGALEGGLVGTIGGAIGTKPNPAGPTDEPCRYLCTTGGGCSVRYAGPAQDGSTVGNCFSEAFGGSCSGTPQGCRDCNTAIECGTNLSGEGSLEGGPAPGIPKYCEISKSHTMCQFKPGSVSERCGSVRLNKVSDKVRQQLLDQHNQLRRKIAKGLQKDQPPAANMREMEWNEELATIAQTWTNQCDCVFQRNEVYPCFHEPTGGHDRSPVPGRGAGQNIAWGTLRSLRGDWTNRAQGWYDEVYDFNATQVDRFIGSTGRVIGHYTQYVWANSYQVGCGVLISKLSNYSFHYLVCNYFPSGNVRLQPVYRQGEACSSCPDGTQCREGLCARTGDRR